eukprot:CAMPEP_0182481726 /NCGR_PEP_ID=MMETSP1319-20130603/37805_1 /TAXON_ID=172717 /ORGANISM="Bolidomonas pacifica, Strain RCC208" /LENGTH=334 /DNA_ID=CAMNT_0024683357 /DNA_START=29 /DNA_END=1033 /DNA_ORIENTATION=-
MMMMNLPREARLSWSTGPRPNLETENNTNSGSFAPLSRATSLGWMPAPGKVRPPMAPTTTTANKLPRGADYLRACEEHGFQPLLKTYSAPVMRTRPTTSSRQARPSYRPKALRREGSFLERLEARDVTVDRPDTSARYSSVMPLATLGRRAARQAHRLGERMSATHPDMSRYSTGVPLSVGAVLDAAAQGAFGAATEQMRNLRAALSPELARYSTGRRLSTVPARQAHDMDAYSTGEQIKATRTRRRSSAPRDLIGRYSTAMPVSVEPVRRHSSEPAPVSAEVLSHYSSNLPISGARPTGFEANLEDQACRPKRFVRGSSMSKYATGKVLNLNA